MNYKDQYGSLVYDEATRDEGCPHGRWQCIVDDADAPNDAESVYAVAYGATKEQTERRADRIACGFTGTPDDEEADVP